ncbi:FimV family protein [Moritella sp. F3]|uniref:type IV pilus assembly protein FimV n=1 Tax=Moritella sp. F3 TaxID=2718882 RepID=UPI0018E113EA|nr:FimV/HubP family polar landmark protein [Moritella sp. F3]GIC75869.1 hypothetical protein FMO001_05960 [Moritella sp. F1]GIC83874.1 hypothetical protein FMO003_41540 [Moritella sp. F3]
MLNGHLLHSRFKLAKWLKLVIGYSITVSQVYAHVSPAHMPQGNPSQDIIVNQLTAGVNSQLQHGPVRKGETLTSIAKQRAPQNTSQDQYIDMIFRLNPQAFISQNKNKLKTGSLLILPGYQQGNDSLKSITTAKPRMHFNSQKVQLIEYNSLLQIKTDSKNTPFLPQIPIRVIAPNSLNQQQKRAKLQAQILQSQQTEIHGQIALLQHISELEQQLTISQESASTLDYSQQQLSLKNKNLLLQIQDLHKKYDHIINNYNFTPKF